MKIYIVTSGSYSDYHIDGVFDNRELAQKYIDSFEKGGWDEMGIEEWELNPSEKEISQGYRPYFVRMAKNGDVKETHIDDSSYGFRGDSGETGFDRAGNMYTHCYAEDSIHAIKIANERRAMMIAHNKWITK